MTERPAELPSTRALRYWGRQGGGFYDTRVSKGCATPNGWTITALQRGSGSNNSVPRSRHYTSYLAENGRARRRTK